MRTDGIAALEPGQHIHLDLLVDDPPAPGSASWLPILDDLVDWLQCQVGHWGVSFPLGGASEIPESSDRHAALQQCDPSLVAEPPSVNRLADAVRLNLWEGESHRWTRQLSASAVETISFSRTPVDESFDEPYWGRLTIEIASS